MARASTSGRHSTQPDNIATPGGFAVVGMIVDTMDQPELDPVGADE